MKAFLNCPVACSPDNKGSCPQPPTEMPTEDPTGTPGEPTEDPTEAPTDTPVCCALDPTLCDSQSRPARTLRTTGHFSRAFEMRIAATPRGATWDIP